MLRDITLLWALRSPCSFGCPHCYFGELADHKETLPEGPGVLSHIPVRDLDRTVLEEFARSLSGSPIERVVLAGGEPLDWLPTLSLIKTIKDAGCEVVVATNGVPLMRPGIAGRLVDLDVDGVSVSLDSADAAVDCVPPITEGVQALVLDFNGTLADTRHGHEDALRAALQPYNVALDPHWYGRHIGLSIHDLLAVLPGGRDLPHGEIVRHSRTHLLAAVHTITPIPCVVELLQQARRAGLPCAVASGASRQLVAPGLDALGLRDAFAAVVAREDVTRGKPDPELFLTAARLLGVASERCLAVDDAPDGTVSARAAGMQVLTVIDGHLTPIGNATEEYVPLPAEAEVPRGSTQPGGSTPASAAPLPADPTR